MNQDAEKQSEAAASQPDDPRGFLLDMVPRHLLLFPHCCWDCELTEETHH
ncbi:hypothetical protein JOB18_042638 [Solea senegalensis]|uniref:Uncharacterized protein n=1 Tax=Solea senegalensis TaxID=28829 RepID=A0AAV6Q6J5_SOLSE|nr:hypothetical protein JOB18_042638 [Solea senegalensis]